MKPIRFLSIPVLALVFVLFPMLTPDETGSMGVVVWGGLLLFSLSLTFTKFRKFPRWSIYAFLMWVSGMLSTILSPYSDVGNEPLKYLAFVILLITLSNYKFKRNDFKIAFCLYSILSLVLSFLIILSAINGYVHVDSIYEGNVRFSIGITGLYKNPNYIAAFIIISVFLTAYILLFNKVIVLYRFLGFAALAVMTVAVFLTGTRAAILTLLILVISLAFFYSYKSKNVLLKIVPLFIFAVLVYYSTDRIVSFVDTFASARGGFMEDSRTESWIFALDKVYESPILGYGINCWNKLRNSSMLPGLHNIFLEFFLNQGILGLVFLFPTMFYGWRKVKHKDIFFVFIFCLVNIFPLMFQNGLIDVTFWRVLLMNRIIIDYSAYSEKGVASLLNLKSI